MLDADLFNQGQKPAIDIGRSVSRVGSSAQEPAMRELVGNLKLELSQYEEVEHFTKFGTEVDKATRQQIERGKRILQTLKQKPNQPLTFPMTIIILYSLNRGYMDQIPISQIPSYESELRDFVSQKETKLFNNIEKEAELTDSIKEELDRVLNTFYDRWIEKKGLRQ